MNRIVGKVRITIKIVDEREMCTQLI